MTAVTARKLLIVEDDVGLQQQLRWCFDGFDVVLADNREGALGQLRRFEPAVVLLDLGLPPDPTNASEGLKALDDILNLAPATKVVVVTGNQERDHALKAVARGAYDYYQKPVDADVLHLIVERAYHLHQLERENAALQPTAFQGLIAVSPQMLQVCKTLERIAPTDVTTLLLGESGTGKELIARALHRLSHRAEQPFVVINCAAIPETLLESELFGYEKGAFTGATRQTKGKIEYADGGTFFLDEVGDLPASLQAKLLRFLQERVIERLGGREEIAVDVRVVCATHRDLPNLIHEGAFREDLYYRISELTVRIPPLREREGDILVIARALLDRYSRETGRPAQTFTSDAVAALEAHDWPGNVRELENKIKRAVILRDGPQITAADLDLAAAASQEVFLNLRQARDYAERQALHRSLARAGGNLSQAAELLGITRPTLYSLLNKHNMKV